MSKFDDFTNLFSLSKTLRFKLIPIGKTMENFKASKMLEKDQQKAEDYKKIKKLMDEYHKSFIEQVLQNVTIDISEYADLYLKKNKSDAEKKKMSELEKSFCKKISDSFTKHERYKKIFGDEMIKKILPEYINGKEEYAGYQSKLDSFSRFSGYFGGLYQARENMYVPDAKSTSIANRCIIQNLPRFIDNYISFCAIKETLSDKLDELNTSFNCQKGNKAADTFNIVCFSNVLSQSGIDFYNTVIGGYVKENGEKVKGLNEYINLYNQTVEKKQRLPLMKALYKQILSDSEGLSFIVNKFESDNELLEAIRNYYAGLEGLLPQLKSIFSNFADYDLDGIYYNNNLSLTNLSQQYTDDWSYAKRAWMRFYEEENPNNSKNLEKYIEKKEKAYKDNESFSVNSLIDIFNDAPKKKEAEGFANIANYLSDHIQKLISEMESLYLRNRHIFEKYESDKKLVSNFDAIKEIKEFLDSVKELENFIKPLRGTGKEEYKDNGFYAEFLAVYDYLSMIDKLYDKVRNYLTQKPYSNDKIKLNFDSPQLLNGWDKNKESDYLSVLLRKNQKYYLAIMAKNNNKAFENAPTESENCYEKMEYKLLPGPNKMLPKVFFSKSRIAEFAPSSEILSIREKESFKKGDNFSLNDCHKMIDFYKESIAKHEDWSKFGFEFKPTSEYKDIGEFFKEVKNQGYSVRFVNVDSEYIDKMVDEGSLYLFQIYNKDFSDKSKGTPNLHTLYFKQLFDEDNLKNVIYKLNGEAELFYREKSIRKEERTIHLAGDVLNNKNPDNTKKTSVFEYDIIKDKRYTDYQFSFHVPITMNFQAETGMSLNEKVRRRLAETKENYVIGIDRGERNLLYICVVNSKGEIVEQFSMNKIENEYNGTKIATDYRTLLDKREEERNDARREWSSIEGIKDLKAGYLSQVVHKIAELVLKYDAIICLEDLNGGFKNSRVKVEKQVYQKFENAMVDKLAYMVDKRKDANELGGLNRALQLATSDLKGMGLENGIIFYVSPWLTSKIDPNTGFANILNTKYKSVEETKHFISSFDAIEFSAADGMFKFDIDFSNFEKGSIMSRKKWTLYSNGTRIKTFRNDKKNNHFDNVEVNLTEEFKTLFDKYEISIAGNIKAELLAKADKDLFEQFMRLFGLMLQMRNSETGNVDVDYLISPVKNKNGEFFDSRKRNDKYPLDADANGAYHIALKGLLVINNIKEADDIKKAKMAISNKEWLEFAQNRF